MASQVDMERKPSIAEWLAEDVWLSTLLRDTWEAFREGYRTAHDETALRFGQQGGPKGPQVRGA